MTRAILLVLCGFLLALGCSTRTGEGAKQDGSALCTFPRVTQLACSGTDSYTICVACWSVDNGAKSQCGSFYPSECK